MARFRARKVEISKIAYARAKEKGVSLEPLLNAAGLTVEQIENPNARLKVRDQISS